MFSVGIQNANLGIAMAHEMAAKNVTFFSIDILSIGSHTRNFHYLVSAPKLQVENKQGYSLLEGIVIEIII